MYLSLSSSSLVPYGKIPLEQENGELTLLLLARLEEVLRNFMFPNLIIFIAVRFL